MPKGTGGALRLRLLGGSLLVIWLAVAVAGWGLHALFVQHVSQQLQDQLILELDHLSASIDWSEENQALLPLADDHDARLRQPLSGLYWQIDRLGEAPQPAIARSPSLWDQVMDSAAAQPVGTLTTASGNRIQLARLITPQGRSWRLVQRELQLPEDAAPVLRLSVAGDEQLLAEPLRRFTRLLLLALGLLALGLSVLVVVQLQLALRPLQALQRQLAAVRSGQAARLQAGFPQEIEPLVQEFNHVLTQNTEMVERARTQAGNLAHALRTPLTILANAAASRPADDALASLVREQTGIANRQVDYQLARARAASAVRATGLRTPVLGPLQALIKTMQRLHAGRNIRFELLPMAAAPAFRGEADDFFELAGNLLDNAGKWARSRVRVSVSLAAPDQLCLCVEDDGPGIPAGQREQLFARGVQLDERHPGVGLGLDIVRTLAETYGGHVAVSESVLGGAAFSLTLPAVA